MYHIPCQGSTGSFRSNLYRTADRDHAHPNRICHRSLAGDQPPAELERLLQWLQEGKWSWVALGEQMARMMVTFFPQLVWFLIIDDTLVCRDSREAPESGVYHEHGNKANRPQYARGQCWVCLALLVTRGKKHAAILCSPS